MSTFEATSKHELAEAVRERKEIFLEISDEVTQFEKDIPAVDFSKPIEAPPSPIIHSAEMAAQMLIHTGSDQEGKYIWLVASVYWGNGKILYRKLATGRYELHIVWPEV